MVRPLLLALLCAACSPANPTPEVAKPIELGGDAGIATGPGFATPAKWTLTFSPRWRPVATLDEAEGKKLHVGDGGERWIETLSGARESASMLAPEPLVGIQRNAGVYRFIGASGTVYVAHEALGSILRTGNSVEGTWRVAVGKTAIVVVDGTGGLQRSIDGGRTWAKVELPQKDLVVTDVALLGDGGLLVTAPQRFFGTKDDGVTWTPVKSPGIGAKSVVAREGALWLDGVDESLRYDPAWGTFQSGAAPPHPAVHAPYGRASRLAQPVTVQRIDGRRAVRVEGNGTERIWTVAVDDMAGPGKAHKVDELDGCESVDAAMRGDDIVIACDARGTVASGIDKDATAPINRYPYNARGSGLPDGGSLGWITRVLKSSDGGRTFREETTVEGGMPQHNDVSIALGPESFIYLGRRCGPGYYAACLPSRVRATRSAGFSDLPEDEPNTGQIRFATSGAQSSIYSLGIRDGEAFLFRWKLGSAVPEPIGRVAASIDPQTATLALDDDGTVRGFARTGTTAMTFAYKEGGTVTTTELGIPFARAAVAGIHGFGYVNVAPGEVKAYESSDGGKTWGVVGAPAFLSSIDGCSAYGCVTDRGVRWAWDAPAGTPDGSTLQTAVPKGQYERPLRCSAKDKWIELGGGNLPSVSYVDHGSVRWLLPTRDKDGKIAVLTSKRGDPTTKTTSTALLGAPPGAPKFGAGTTVHVQPDGVVAVRYSYLRERKGYGRYNPVDAQIGWYRDGGKVFHVSVAKNPPFRVNKDPQAQYDRDAQPMYSDLPELVTLGPKGVYFHPAIYAQEPDDSGNTKRDTLYLLHDDGKTDKITIPDGVEYGSGTGIGWALDGVPTLLARNPESWQAVGLNDGHKTTFSVLGGLGDDDGTVDPVMIGGKPFFGATLRDPARAWLVGLKADPELGATTTVPTQKSLGDTPKPCDGAPAADPNAYRIDEPYVLGSRRPVVVDSDGVAIVMATDRAEIRGTVGQADACVAAFDAMLPATQDDRDYGALVFTDDMSHSLLFRADSSSWPATISVRTMECQYQAGPLPDELQNVEGFIPDHRHSAVPRKRY